MELNDQLDNFIKYIHTQIDTYPQNISQQRIKAIEELILSEIDKNLLSYGRWDGVGTGLFSYGNQRWSPLSINTVKSYISKGYKNFLPTLRRTGHLIRQTSAQHRGNLRFEIGSNAPYARDIQEGTYKMPPRPFIVLSPEAITKINNIIFEGLLKERLIT